MLRLSLLIGAAAAAIVPSLSALAQTNNAVGRLNYAGYKERGHCTVVLVSRTTALTAGHCVDRWKYPELRLVFGYEKSQWKELRRIKSIKRHKKRDVAVLCLDKPSKIKPIPTGTDLSIKQQVSVNVTGYRRNRPHLQSVFTCSYNPKVSRTRLDCPAERGMSGSPVVAQDKDGPKVIGITVKGTRVYSRMTRLIDLPEAGCK